MSSSEQNKDGGAFSQPRLAINRVYTRRGDGGQTSLVGGERVAKDAIRIDAYGTVDELNAFVGAARLSIGARCEQLPALTALERSLWRVQHELFNLGAILATPPAQVHASQPRIRAAEVAALEAEIDQANGGLAPLRSFVLPGATRASAELHMCRTICRRAERIAIALSRQEPVDAEVIAYLNRLSDALFVWSRWVDAEQGASECLWDPNVAASAVAKGG